MNISFEEYMDKVFKPSNTYAPDKIFDVAFFGLAGEVGELLDERKKMLRDNNNILSPNIRQKMISEVGDIFWYLCLMLQALDTNIAEVAEANRQKLSNRGYLVE